WNASSRSAHLRDAGSVTRVIKPSNDLDEPLDQLRALGPVALDARAHVHAPRMGPFDRLAHVVGGEAAGEEPVCDRGAYPRPVVRYPRAAVAPGDVGIE